MMVLLLLCSLFMTFCSLSANGGDTSSSVCVELQPPSLKCTMEELPNSIVLPTLHGAVTVHLEIKETQNTNEFILVLTPSSEDVLLHFYAVESGWNETADSSSPALWSGGYSPADMMKGRVEKTVLVNRPPATDSGPYEAGIEVTFHTPETGALLGTVHVIVFSK